MTGVVDIRFGAVGLQLRSAGRQRWGTWLFLSVLLGVVAGGVAAAWAASRRTDTAYERFAEQTKGFDLILFAGCTGEAGCPPQDDVAERLNGLASVADAARVVEVTADYFLPSGEPADPSGDPCYAGGGQMVLLLSPDGRFGNELNQAVVIAGRQAIGPAEVVIADSLAKRSGLGVGDVIVASPSVCAGDVVNRPHVGLTIVGIQVSVGELRPERGLYIGAIHGDGGLEPLFAEHGYPRQNLVMVRLQPSSTVEQVIAEAETAGLSVGEVARGDDVARGVQIGLDNDARILALLALLSGFGAVALVGPVLARFARDAMADAPTLRCLGATRNELATVGAGHGLAIGLAAAPVVVMVQAVVSLLTPAGRAAVFEISPGWHLDAVVVVLVALAAILFSVVVTAVTTTRVGGGCDTSMRRITTAGHLAMWIGLSPAATAGVRMALEPRHRSSRVPIRSGLAGIALALASVIGVLTYRSSLDYLDHTPSLVGWSWDDAIELELPAGSSASELVPVVATLTERARELPGVVAASRATFDAQPVADGVVVCAGELNHAANFMAFESGTGKIVPTVASGRAPAGPDEVALSAQLLERLDVGIGDTVALGSTCSSEHFTVVGVSVLPFGPDLDAIVATGALTLDGFHRFRPDYPGDLLLVELDGTRSATEIANQLRAAGHPVGDPVLDQRRLGTQELSGTTLSDTTVIPLILGLLTALSGLAVVAYLIAVATASRRREIATLRALGLRRRQVFGAVFVQATILFGVAFLIAVPIGLIGGRVAWQRTAERLGILDRPEIPWIGLTATFGTGLLLALLAAAWPASRTARVPITEALRTE